MEEKTAGRGSATKKKSTKKKKSTRKSTKKKDGDGTTGSKIDVKVDGKMVRVSREIGGRTLTLETGRMAKQADGAIITRYGDTVVLSTAQSSKARDDIDFFPLTVDYRERYPAAGRFPGGFFKREGRPTNREILTCRIIDRSIRPLFPDGFKKECQVLSQVLATDMETESDVVAAIGSFAALAVSSIPHQEHLGACRIGMIDGKFIINPTWTQVKSAENDLTLTLAGHKDAIVMVEAGANEVEEDVILEALRCGKDVCAEVAELVTTLVKEAGKEKMEFTPPKRDEELDAAIAKKFASNFKKAVSTKGDKHERSAASKAVREQAHEAFPAPEGADEKKHKKYVNGVCNDIQKKAERETILKGRRSDGRDSKTIREITIEVGVLPRVHGSVLFTRGETQSLCIATLGTVDDRQNRDGIYQEDPQHFMLHYTFPPFCVGEVRRMMGPGRREIGHGTLAERSVERLLPSREEFPYTMRVTSEILESNGSSSMASVCGGTLALMDAGVPLRQPVAGIAMGLVMEGKKYEILSDILGSEDHCGDMDFKVAGTGKGLTALQMDIKCDGLTQNLLTEALEQARQGRLHILKKMLSALARPRSDISPNAPRILTVQVPVEKIGFIIGPSGKNIRALQADYGVKISIDDTGLVNIGGFDAKTAEACAAYIGDMTREVEPGELYTGRVTSIKDFGCFVEILPGQEGLCHVSELSNEFIHAVTDVVRIGDSLEVKVLDIDDFGKIKLSHKATLSGDGDDDKEPVFKRGKGRSVDDYEDGAEEAEEIAEEVDENSAEDDSDDYEDGDGAEEVEESRSSTDSSRSRDAGPQDRGGRDRGRSKHGGRDGGDRDRGGRSDRGDRPSRGRSDRPDRDRGGRGDRDRPARSDSDRGGRGDRDRPARSDRDRGGRGDRDRPERSDRDRGDRDRPASSDRDRGDRDRPERSDRDRGGRGDRDRPASSDRDRGGRGDRDRSDRPSRRPRRDRD